MKESKVMREIHEIMEKVYEEEKNSTPWVIIIPDEDRALFHVNAEAQTIEEAQELARKYVSKIKEWQGE